jgi:4-hydroxybenzoate polyprenyltransferase
MEFNSITFLIKFYRVKDWIKNLGIFLLAFTTNKAFQLLTFSHFVVLSYGGLLFAFAYSINNYFDALLANEKNFILFLLKEKKFSKRKVVILCFLPFFFLLPLFLQLCSLNFICISILLLWLAVVYSAPPLRLKNIPFFDLVINFLFFPLIYVQTVLFFSYFSAHALILTIILAFNFALYELIHQMAHLNMDKKAGRITTTIKLGAQTTLSIIKGMPLIFILSILPFILFAKKTIFCLLLGAIGFNLLRICHFRKLTTNSNFAKLRNWMFLSEGLCYLIINLFF